MSKQLNQWLDEFVENGADANNVTDWPEEAGGGTSYSAGDGINITDNTIAVNDTVVRKLNVSNIRSLTPEQCENLNMGDLVTDGATTYEVYQKGLAPHNTAFINLKYNAYGSVWTAVYTKPDGGEWSFVSDTEHIVPYTAGEGIDIDINGVISVAGGGENPLIQVTTLGLILSEGQNKSMSSGIVNYEGIRDLVKQHLDDIELSNDCYLNILPIILDQNDLSNPKGLLCIQYWHNSCNGHYYINIYTSNVYGSLSSQTSIDLENGLHSLYDLVDYLYDNSINTEIAVQGSSGYVTGAQNNTLCINSIRYEELDSVSYGTRTNYEHPLGTNNIISEVFTPTGS